MNTTNWITYMESARGDDNDSRTALRMNLSQSAITRWRAGTQPRPQQVVDFARLYGANALTGLIAAGYLNQRDLAELGTTVAAPADLSEITTAQLLDELQRRLTELRETFDTLERTSDRAALETLVEALTSRHLPAANVGGTEQTASIRSIDEHRASKLEIDYDPDNTQLVEESLADRYAALEADDPEHEQIAPDTP